VITSGCISKSSTLIATGGDDGRAHVWNIDQLGLGTGSSADVDDAPKLILEGSGSQLDTILFDTQETYIAGGTSSGAINVWDMNSSQPLRTLAGHRSAVTALHFHPFGKYFTSGSQDCNLKLWDVRKKGTIQTYKGHTAPITSVRHSPDGRWVFSADADGNVKVWDISSAKFLLGFQASAATGRKGGSAAVTSMVFHPVEFLLAIACNERQLAFWDVERFVPLEISPVQSSPIHSLNFYGETGHALIAASTDNVRSWTWEPITCHGNVEATWGKLLDTSIDPIRDALLGLSAYHNVVSVYQLDINALSLPETPAAASSAAASSAAAVSGSYPSEQAAHVRDDVGAPSYTPQSSSATPNAVQSTHLHASHPQQQQQQSQGSQPQPLESKTPANSVVSRVPPQTSVSALDEYAALTSLSAQSPHHHSPASYPQSGTSVYPSSITPGQSTTQSPGPSSVPNAVPIHRSSRTALRNQTSANFPLQVNYSFATSNKSSVPPAQEQALATAFNEHVNVRSVDSARAQPTQQMDASADDRSTSAHSSYVAQPHTAVRNASPNPMPMKSPSPSGVRLGGEGYAPSAGTSAGTPTTASPQPIRETRSSISSSVTQPPVPTRVRPSPTSSDVPPPAQTPSASEPVHITQPGTASRLPRDPLQGTIVPVSAVVQDRAQPLGLDPSAFLPPAVDSSQLATPTIDPEATRQAVMEHHAVMATVVNRRLQNIRVLKTFWAKNNVRGTLEALERMQDAAVCFDFLSAAERALTDPRSQLQLTLDTTLPLLDVLDRLMRSRVETHALLALKYLVFVLRAFSERILSTLAAAAQGDAQGAGIDIVQEERIDKCIKLFEGFKRLAAALAVASQTHAQVRSKSSEATALLESLLGTSEE